MGGGVFDMTRHTISPQYWRGKHEIIYNVGFNEEHDISVCENNLYENLISYTDSEHFINSIVLHMFEYSLVVDAADGICSVSHRGVTIWWPIYISHGFSAHPFNVK